LRILSVPVSWITASLLAALAVIHVYWAFGGRRGAGSVVPELDGKPLFRPRAFETVGVAVLLLVAAALVLARAGTGLDVFPRIVSAWGTRALAVVLVVRSIGDFRYVGFFKRHRGTSFARLDTFCYSPLALALGLGAAVVAWSGG
jgi:Protein of unknown function (DUF3995)